MRIHSPVSRLLSKFFNFFKLAQEPNFAYLCQQPYAEAEYRHLICTVLVGRVSEPACLGAAPAPGIFYLEPRLAPDNREHNFGIF